MIPGILVGTAVKLSVFRGRGVVKYSGCAGVSVGLVQVQSIRVNYRALRLFSQEIGWVYSLHVVLGRDSQRTDMASPVLDSRFSSVNAPSPAASKSTADQRDPIGERQRISGSFS